MNIKMILAYDGTGFLGWQESMDGMTIEEILRKTLEQVYQHPISLKAASRTDRGVHAAGQVVHYFTKKVVDFTRLKISLNQLLPSSIRILDIKRASDTFHSTWDAIKKEYHYFLCLSVVQSPFRRYFSWHLPHVLDIDLMRQGALAFIGTHDFTSLSNQRRPQTMCPFCTLYRLDIIKKNLSLHFEIEGNRFLYKMVRNLVGTLVNLGMGKLSLTQIENLISQKDRKVAGVTAPAHGLFLKQIHYAALGKPECLA